MGGLGRDRYPGGQRAAGEQGVVLVDFRHWEIPGDRKAILDLLRHIWERARRGEDRFRWVGKQMQRAALRRFLNADPRLVIEEAKRCCHRKLAERAGGRRPLGNALGAELRASPPAVPEERIRARAEAIWRQRLGAGMAGHEVQDWLSAEQELRHVYEQQLLAYTQPHPPGGQR